MRPTAGPKIVRSCEHNRLAARVVVTCSPWYERYLKLIVKQVTRPSTGPAASDTIRCPQIDR